MKITRRTVLEEKCVENFRKPEKIILGWKDVVDQLLLGIEATMESEIYDRAAKRAKLLEKAEIAELHRGIEREHHKRSMKHVKYASEQFEELFKQDTSIINELKSLHKDEDKVSKIRKESFDALDESILEYDFKIEEVKIFKDKLVDSYDKNFSKNGINGLINSLKEDSAKFLEKRSDEKNERGRNEHGSWADWKNRSI